MTNRPKRVLPGNLYSFTAQQIVPGSSHQLTTKIIFVQSVAVREFKFSREKEPVLLLILDYVDIETGVLWLASTFSPQELDLVCPIDVEEFEYPEDCY